MIASKGAWLASLVPLETCVLEHESWLIQKVLKAPWQALPTKLLLNLKKAAGGPFEITSLETIGIAGKCRSALHTSTVYHSCCKEVRGMLQGDTFLEAEALGLAARLHFAWHAVRGRDMPECLPWDTVEIS